MSMWYDKVGNIIRCLVMKGFIYNCKNFKVNPISNRGANEAVSKLE